MTAADLEKHDSINVQCDEQRIGHFVMPTADEEKAVVRRLDRRLLPLVFVLYTLAILDRSNLGNAKIAAMGEQIDLTGNKYNLLGTVFYIAYICFQWTAMGWKQFKPHHFAAFCVLFWGLIASVQAAVQSWGGLMACRVLLGIAEAMFGPGVPLYLTFFYPRDKVAFRQGIFISGAAAANVYGGVLAYGITQIKGAIAPWRILFLIEGLPTILFAAVTFYFLPDGIRQAKFLSPREKEVALHMAGRNQRLDLDGEQGLRWREALQGMLDPKSWLPAIMYFSVNVSYASLPLFIPTIISEIGAFSTPQSQGLSAPPYVLAFFVILLFTWLSDRLQVRGPFCAAGGLLGAIGFIINANTVAAAPRYFSLFLSVLVFSCIPILLAWVSSSNNTESRRAGAMTVMYTIGQCGPLVGTNIFTSDQAPRYLKGLWISAGFCLFVVLVSGTLSFWLIRENRQMDDEGVPEVAALEDTSVTVAEDGENKVIRRPVQQKMRYLW